MFILGAVVDGAIALSWFLIASGSPIPNILNGYTGTGSDYQLAMHVGAMFMAGWAILLAVTGHQLTMPSSIPFDPEQPFVNI
jgi:hypothetical protein